MWVCAAFALLAMLSGVAIGSRPPNNDYVLAPPEEVLAA